MPLENQRTTGRQLISVHMKSSALYCVRTVCVITGQDGCVYVSVVGAVQLLYDEGLPIQVVRFGIVFENGYADIKC